MRTLAGVMGAVLGLLLVGAGGYFALVYKPPPPKPATQVSSEPPPSDPSVTPHPDKPVAAPMSREEQLKEELGEKRLPFFRYLRQNYSNVILRFSVLDDYDTLDLVVARSDDATLQGVIQQAIAPSAKQYGFRRVRFYIRNAPNSVDPFTVIAESSEDGSGRWNTFRK